VAGTLTEYDSNNGKKTESLHTINVAVKNPNLNGLTLSQVPALTEGSIVCSRLKRGSQLYIPKPNTRIETNDLLHLVGNPKALDKARLVIGEEVDTSLSTRGTDLRVQRLVVTNEIVLGKKIRDLELKEKYDVVVSRLNRAGVELVPTSQTSLQFGDILNLVGLYRHWFRGITRFYPTLSTRFSSSNQTWFRLYWFMPPSANLALREIGIVLFLAVVGLKSGGGFVDTLVNGDGLSWMGYGILITFLPLMITAIVARMFGGLNYLTICGMLAGSMTDPPALAFANGLHPTSGAAALSYATVYPLVMCLRIISPQLLALLLWAM